MIGHCLICAFVERWHKETFSFHLPFGEMTVTLDDVASLLHIPIDDMLPYPRVISCKNSATLKSEICFEILRDFSNKSLELKFQNIARHNYGDR